MKISRRFFSMTMTAALIAVFAVSLFAQDPDAADTANIGDFDVDMVNSLVSSVDDTALVEEARGLGAYTRQPENYALVLLRIVGYLVLVTIIIFAAAWGVRKFGVAGASKVGAGSNMDIIENIYFGQNRGAALIRVSDAVYLLGHTPENIVMLEKIEGQKAVDIIASAKGNPTIMNFKDAFNGFLGKMKGT